VPICAGYAASARQIEPTCRWSVPQQPPTTVSPRQQRPQRPVLRTEFLGIAVVEFAARIELGVAATRGVGAQSADALAPVGRFVQRARRSVSGARQFLIM